ncbi:hypothetical protein MRX96_011020 [Rhipicephalus microplus]
MHVTNEERGPELSSTEASPVQDERSPSVVTPQPDATSVKTTTSPVSDGSGAEISLALADSVGDRPRRSFLHLSLASAARPPFQEDLDAAVATDSEEAVLVNGVPTVDDPPPALRPQIKYGFEDEPVHWKESLVTELNFGAGTEKGPKPQCGQFRFSFCSERRGGGVYYDAALASCLPVSAELAYVCNRSPNRFSSLHECRRSCVEPTKPQRRCLSTPVFSLCDRELTRSWWFSNGTQCEEWRFPQGLCPAQKKLVVGYDGRFRCLEATTSTLAGYQCLIGANRFDTIDACNSTCIDNSGDHE